MYGEEEVVDAHGWDWGLRMAKGIFGADGGREEEEDRGDGVEGEAEDVDDEEVESEAFYAFPAAVGEELGVEGDAPAEEVGPA